MCDISAACNKKWVSRISNFPEFPEFPTRKERRALGFRRQPNLRDVPGRESVRRQRFVALQ